MVIFDRYVGYTEKRAMAAYIYVSLPLVVEVKLNELAAVHDLWLFVLIDDKVMLAKYMVLHL